MSNLVTFLPFMLGLTFLVVFLCILLNNDENGDDDHDERTVTNNTKTIDRTIHKSWPQLNSFLSQRHNNNNNSIKYNTHVVTTKQELEQVLWSALPIICLDHTLIPKPTQKHHKHNVIFVQVDHFQHSQEHRVHHENQVNVSPAIWTDPNTQNCKFDQPYFSDMYDEHFKDSQTFLLDVWHGRLPITNISSEQQPCLLPSHLLVPAKWSVILPIINDQTKRKQIIADAQRYIRMYHSYQARFAFFQRVLDNLSFRYTYNFITNSPNLFVPSAQNFTWYEFKSKKHNLKHFNVVIGHCSSLADVQYLQTLKKYHPDNRIIFAWIDYHDDDDYHQQLYHLNNKSLVNNKYLVNTLKQRLLIPHSTLIQPLDDHTFFQQLQYL